MALLITTCTNRKLKPVSGALHAGSLPVGGVSDLAREWVERVTDAKPRYPASALYAGRGFQEARTAANALGAPLFIVSAGLGLVEASAEVPAYACTVVNDTVDSIAGRASGTFALQDWWQSLTSSSPFSSNLKDVFARSKGLILAALSDSYLTMIGADLVGARPKDLARLRIFTRMQPARLPPMLLNAWMPYDDRMEGDESPIPGTMGDFASRAVRHFVDHIVVENDDRDAAAHAAAVSAALEGWSVPEQVERVRHDDGTMRVLIAEHWPAGDRRGPTLRYFRDDLLVACEQTRFKNLKADVARARS